MATHYRIVDWDLNYEVNNHGKRWEPGEEFRRGELLHVRVSARRDLNVRVVLLHRMVGEHVWFVVGVFEKLCSIVGCEDRTERVGGIIRNSECKPATDEDICEMLLLTPETWEDTVRLLTHPRIHWLCKTETGEGSEAAGQPQEATAPSGLPVTPTGQADPASRGESGVSRISRNSGKTGESQEFPAAPEIPEIPEFPLSRQVNPSQVESKTSQEKTIQSSREGVRSLSVRSVQPQEPCRLYDIAPYRQSDASGGKFDRNSLGGSLDSTRLGFTCLLSDTLRPTTKADIRSLSNLEHWLFEQVTSGRASPSLGQEIQELARDCVRGDNPMAVFMARVKRELGYTPPTKAKAVL